MTVPVTAKDAINMGASIDATFVTFNGTSQAANTDVTLWTPFTIPANFLTVGSCFWFMIGLDIDIINSATARNFVNKLKLGGGTLLSTTTAVTASSGNNNGGGLIQGCIKCEAVGAAGIIRGYMQSILTATTSKANVGCSSVAGATVDTTATIAVSFTINETVNSVADLVRAESGLWLPVLA